MPAEQRVLFLATDTLSCWYLIITIILTARFVDSITCPYETSAGSSSVLASVSASSSVASGISGSISNTNKVAGAIGKRKVCPDFKDNENEKFCCPSHVVPGSYYCCSLESLNKIEAEQAAELRRQFIKKLVLLSNSLVNEKGVGSV